MERIEEYLEAIYDIQKKKKVVKTSDLAKYLNIKPASVTEMFVKLKNKGYIEYKPYRGAILTKEGEEIARKIKRYYRSAYIFFKILGIEDEKARELACELEHHMSDEALIRICTIVADYCDACKECLVKVSSSDKVKDGKYLALVVPSELLSLIKPKSEVEIRNSRIFVNNVEIEVSEEIKKFLLLKKLE